MEPLALDRLRLQDLIEVAGTVLEGDWVLLGGAVAALCFNSERVTEDIDLVSIQNDPQKRHELMDFALGQGLPIEAVNSAADFFLRREHGWDEELVLLHKGSRARIFRPTPTLFLLLKCSRMSEADLSDCLAQIAHAAAEGRQIDTTRILKRMDREDAEGGEGARSRRAHLRKAIIAVQPDGR